MAHTLKEAAYETIRGKLISGEYAPGSRLSDDSIAREIGISRSPVREAINQFVSEGFVEYRPRCGTYVRSLSWQEFSDLWGVRMALESHAAMEAVDCATRDDIEELDSLNGEILQLARCCRELSDHVADAALKKRFLHLDSEFHLGILAAAGNRRLMKIVQDCRLMALLFGRHHSRLRITADLLMLCHRDHALIVKAIQNSDRDNAREWTVSHIRAARDRAMAWQPPGEVTKESA